MRHTVSRRILLIFCVFVGLGAVGGSAAMLIDPTGVTTGMAGLLPGLQKLPFAKALFSNLRFSGVMLLLVNGLSNLLAAGLILRKKALGEKLGGLFGITLMLWICIQFFIFESNWLSNSYFVFGLIQAAAGYDCYVYRQRESHPFSKADYPNVAKNAQELVVYFSRTNRAKRMAYVIANERGAEVFELRTTEPTAGVPGFWWCGRFAMHKWDMPLVDMPKHLQKYEKVTLVSPVWVFGLSCPMRAFTRAAKGQIHRAEMVLVHFTPFPYRSAFREASKLLGIPFEKAESVSCRVERRPRRKTITL